jgi:hypothetical protein
MTQTTEQTAAAVSGVPDASTPKTTIDSPLTGYAAQAAAERPRSSKRAILGDLYSERGDLLTAKRLHGLSDLEATYLRDIEQEIDRLESELEERYVQQWPDPLQELRQIGIEALSIYKALAGSQK